MISRYDSFETCTSLTNFVRTVTNISYWFVSQISRFPAGLGYNLQICVQEERQECGSFPYQSYPVEVISPPAPTPPAVSEDFSVLNKVFSFFSVKDNSI